jgi:hypothetical protein
MPIASVANYVKSLLDGLAMPGGEQDMAAYIDAPDPNTQTQIPAAYVWPTDVDEKRDPKDAGTFPRNQGPGTPSGFKTEAHSIDVYIVWMGSADDPEGDSIFPGIVDAAMAALRTAYPMPAIITDPYTGAQTQASNIGESMRGQIFVSALEDEGYLRYDAKLTVPVLEVIQA